MSSLNVTGHGWIDYLVIFLFTIKTIQYAIAQPRKLLLIIPAALTFYFFVVFVTILTPIKFLPLLVLFLTTATGNRKYLALSGRIWHKLVLGFIVLGIIMGIYFISRGFDLPFPSPHTRSRLPVQIFSYVNLIVLFLIMARECRTEEGLKLFVKAFIWTTTFLCAYGIYQIIAAKTGLPFRGLVRGYGNRADAVLDEANFIFRINSLVTEPKRLSYVLFLGVILILGMRKVYQDQFMTRLRANALIALHIYCMLMTYSTSIYIALALFAVLQGMASIRIKRHRYYLKLFSLGFLVFILSLPFTLDRILLLYQMRVVDNLDSERTEDAAVEYLLDHPGYMITGVGLGNYNFLLSEAFPPGDAGIGEDGNLLPLNSAIITLIFDMGLPGTLLIFLPAWRYLWSRKKFNNPLARTIALPVMLFLLATSVPLNPLPVYFAFAGALEGCRRKFADV